MPDRLTIRSFAAVDDIDRRIYYLDSINKKGPLPWPQGVPWEAIGYFLGTVVFMAILSKILIIGDIVGIIPPPFRYIMLPIVVTFLGIQSAPDGRKAHRFAIDAAAFHIRHKRWAGGTPVPLPGEKLNRQGRMRVWHDAQSPRLQRARIEGPATVKFNVPIRCVAATYGWLVRNDGYEDQVLQVKKGERLEVIP